MTSIETRVKMIIQQPRWQIDVMAWERDIPVNGLDKDELARRIAEHEEEKSRRINGKSLE